MKLHQLFEGHWSIPNTEDKARKVAELLSKPLAAKDATHVLYNLVGNDMLFDEIGRARNKDGADTNVAPMVKNWIKNELFKDFDDSEERRDKPLAQNAPSAQWDSKALEILQNM